MLKKVENIFTVDVEEWHHRITFRSEFKQNNIITTGSAEKGVRIIHELLEKYNSKATYFFLGEVAENTPELIKYLFVRGNEIGCHGYSHNELHRLGPSRFDEEIKKATSIIKNIVKISPKGFRAPRMSLSESTKWALPILQRNGYNYDASIYPAKTGLYGNSKAPIHPYRISFTNPLCEDINSKFFEFPGLIWHLNFLRIPVKLRHMGSGFAINSIRKLNKKGYPAVVIIHPWELIEEPVSVKKVKLPFAKSKIRNLNIPCTKQLEILLKEFRFISVQEYFNIWRNVNAS